MQNDYVLTTNDDGDLAIRTVSATENENVTDTTSVITRTDDGKLAVRVVGNGGGSDQHSLGYFTTLAELQDTYPTAAAGDWAIVAETDTVYIWDDAQSAWIDTDRRGQVSSVNGYTGEVELTAADVGALPTTGGVVNGSLFVSTLYAGVPNGFGAQLNFSDNTAAGVAANIHVVNSRSGAELYISIIRPAICIGGHNLYPAYSEEYTLGTTTNKWSNLYTTNINNGADIAVPTTGGTMARLEDLPAAETGTTGQVYTKTASGAEWADAPAGVTDYTELTNKPAIDGVTLTASSTKSDLGLSGVTFRVWGANE